MTLSESRYISRADAAKHGCLPHPSPDCGDSRCPVPESDREPHERPKARRKPSVSGDAEPEFHGGGSGACPSERPEPCRFYPPGMERRPGDGEKVRKPPPCNVILPRDRR